MFEETVYLVDGTALCYRSHFALKLSNSRGLPTGSVYGTYQTLKKINSKYKPLYMGVCFDVSRKTFRQDKFKQYKIKRPPLPDELKTQIPLVKELISYLGIQLIEKKGFEADDVIATLCESAVKAGKSVVIVSSDKDLYQLMNSDRVYVYNYHKDVMISRSDFIKEKGFTPEQIVDYLALAGDSTDNIPGAKGIGKVTAAKLIKEFKTIENLFKNLDKLPEKTKDILKNDKKNIVLSKELVKLEPPSLDLGWQDLEIDQINHKALYGMFSELEFKTLLKEIPAPAFEMKLEVKDNITKESLASLCKGPLCLAVGGNKVSVYDHSKSCFYKLDITKLRDCLCNKQIKKLSHSFKQEIYPLGLDIEGVWFDTKIAAYLLDSSLVDYELETLVSHFLGKHIKEIDFEFKPYFIYRLYELFLPKLKEQGLDKLFFEVEMPLIGILSQMQKQGVKVEPKILKGLLGEVDLKIEAITGSVFKAAGHKFNLNSPKQLGVVLFEELGIAPLKKTKTGYSTSEEVLEKLSLNYSIAKEIIDYRHLNKLKNTYINPLIEAVGKNKGMLHTQFNQVVAQTGRLSSSEPNLQSIPSRGEFSTALRKAFVSSFPKGNIISGDYSQIELRILAHLSEDENLIRAFCDDLDIHAHTASLLFGLSADKVSDLKRNIAKRVNFGIIYGMSSYGLARELKIGPEEAQNFIDDYFKRYPGVKDYSKKVQAQAKNKGFVTTILGRQRKLPEINSSNLQLKEFALRQAINAPIQGSCADIIKLAMIKIHQEIEAKKMQTKLIIQIHDELIFDVPSSELNSAAAIIRQGMENSLKLEVPIKVNLKAGKNWGQLKEVK